MCFVCRRKKLDGPKLEASAACCNLVEQINRLVINKLAPKVEYLKNAQVSYCTIYILRNFLQNPFQVDLHPRVESSWFAGGMLPPLQVQRYRKNHPYSDQPVDEPTDRAIQYFANPLLTVRTEHPLQPIVSRTESTAAETYPVPYFEHDPRVNDVVTTHRHLTNIPGFWPGDEGRFGGICWLRNARKFGLSFADDAEYADGVRRQAVLAGFGWLNAISNNLGFTSFNDITYPIVTQIIVTDGYNFTFGTYQLNTLLLHSNNTSENPLRNILWITPEMKLFDPKQPDTINPQVISNLLKFYSNSPKQRLGVNYTPYLSDEAKVAADYTDDDKSLWLEKNYKHYMANKGWHFEMEQVYAWEKIYKVDNKTRPMDKKLKMFELKMKKPQDRRLDERLAEYVPRFKRPDLPKHKGRYKKEYFP